MNYPPSAFANKNSSRIARQASYPSETCLLLSSRSHAEEKTDIRSANITTKCPLISAAARIGLSCISAADSIEQACDPFFAQHQPRIGSRQPASSESSTCTIATRVHVAFHDFGHPQPLARTLAQRHANRIRALRARASTPRAFQILFQQSSESPELRSSESSRDFESSTAPVPAQECRLICPASSAAGCAHRLGDLRRLRPACCEPSQPA